jgi:hypothetical protein
MTLAVIDNAVGAGSTKEARIQGWETCVSVLNGVPSGSFTIPGLGAFPSGSQSGLVYPSGGGYMITRKTFNVDAAIRPWYVFADSSSMYCLILTADVTSSYFGFGFGDIYSFMSGSDDTHRCMIVGRVVENSAVGTNENLDLLGGASAGTVAAGHYMARSYTGLGVSLQVGAAGDGFRGNINSLGGLVQYPNGTDSSLYVSPVFIHEITNRSLRGRMRGFYQACHPIAGFSDGMSFTGSGNFSSYLSGRTFTIIKQSGNLGVYMIETSNTVEANY